MTGKPHIFGGGKRVFMQIMKGLSKHTFNVLSCCSLSSQQEEELHAEGVRIIKTHLSEYNPIVSILRLSNIMRNEDIHIVHSQGGRADFYSRVAAFIARVPIVVSSTAVLVDRYDVSLPRRMLYVFCDRITEQFVNKFVVVSENLRESLIRDHGIAPERITKIYNGIELDRYRPSLECQGSFRTECLVGKDDFLVGSVGRLVYEKGYEFLLKATPLILASCPRAKIVIVGDGPLKSKLRNLTRELGIVESCLFVGFREDIANILSSLDVFVLPSIMEGLPIVILEAMAMAKPIVASDIDGIREQVENGRTGILIPPREPQALAEGINQLLKDRFQAQGFGMEARKQVEEMFDIRRQVALHEEVYKGLLKGRRAEV
jgi:glycosyltransferase involved in cell wall biosynthesis